jgi:hypothetical protein
MRRSLALLFATALALVVAASASAMKPSVETGPMAGFTDTSLCGFPIDVSFSGSVRTTTYFSQDGVPTRQLQIFGHFVVTFTTSEASLTTGGPAPTILTFDANGDLETVVIVGLNAAITIPGQGVVLLDAGRVVLFDATGQLKPESGFHAVFGSGDAPKFCAALAAPG